MINPSNESNTDTQKYKGHQANIPITRHPTMQNEKRILRIHAVIDRTGCARSTIYLKISQGIFPKPIMLGERAVGWLAAEVDAWIDARIQESRKNIN